ncbi:MAG: hypothetical protein ACJ781_20370 [Myxococcales bacterium]
MRFLAPLPTLAAMAAMFAVGCAHQSAPIAEAQMQPVGGRPHLAAGCLAVCQEATYIELSPKGDLCRCWAPNAFQYTFAFPDTKDKLDYSRSRWSTGMKNVRRCRAEGKAWEPSDDREQIVCLDTSTPPEQGQSAANPSEQDRSAGAPSLQKLPESVF